MSERLEQIIGEIARWAPPANVHDWENRVRKIMQEEKQEAVHYSREGIYEYLYQSGALVRPY